MTSSKKEHCVIYIIEKLTVLAWLFFALPQLICRKFRQKSKQKWYFIDGSRAGVFIAKITALLFCVRFDKLNFRLVDIKDEEGYLLRLRIAYKDLQEVQENILCHPVCREFFMKNELKDRHLAMYIAKGLADTHYMDDSTLWRVLLLVQIAAWTAGKEQVEQDSAESVLFISEKIWWKEIETYAQNHGVRIRSVRWSAVNFKKAMINYVGFKRLRGMYHYYLSFGFMRFIMRMAGGKSGRPASPEGIPNPYQEMVTEIRDDVSPKLMVGYYGNLNLDDPKYHSQLSFWQQSKFSAENIIIAFPFSKFPLDEAKLKEVRQHGMKALALYPKSTTYPYVPVGEHWPDPGDTMSGRKKGRNAYRSPEGKWLEKQASEFNIEYKYWLSIFRNSHSKIYTTWYKFDGHHCAVAKALRDAGGILTIYQRSFEEFPEVEGATIADVVFAFSKFCVSLERQCKSLIPYHITTGYLGDHRFPLLKSVARKVREDLIGKGAKRIVAYLDENSGNDSRWHTGHEFMQLNYEFLLTKLLENPWLGLVFKPKAPASLKQRLGKVDVLLEKALATGRCYLFDGGWPESMYPPAAAALAADIVIHGHVAGGTAGVESALAGVPTLMLDREGLPSSMFYRLGKNHTVFNDWPTLWQVCQEHWNSRLGIPGFGDWSEIIDDIDPFRDGRAAERMGMYLHWLLEGFKADLPRDTVLADAAQRYATMWGKDKVASINALAEEKTTSLEVGLTENRQEELIR